MVDIAAVGIKAELIGVEDATKNLKELTAAAQGVEAGKQEIAKFAKEANVSISSVNKALSEQNKALQQSIKEQEKAYKQSAQQVSANAKEQEKLNALFKDNSGWLNNIKATQDAAHAQAFYNEVLGVTNDVAKKASASATIFTNAFKEQDIAAKKAAKSAALAAKEQEKAIKATALIREKDFLKQYNELEKIEALKAKQALQAAPIAQQSYNQILGVRESPIKKASDSASVFTNYYKEQEKAAKEAAKQDALAQAIADKELARIDKINKAKQAAQITPTQKTINQSVGIDVNSIKSASSSAASFEKLFFDQRIALENEAAKEAAAAERAAKQQIAALEQSNKELEARIAAEIAYQTQAKQSATYLSELANKNMSVAEAANILKAAYGNLTTAQDKLLRLESSSLSSANDIANARTRAAEATKLYGVAVEQASKHGTVSGGKITEVYKDTKKEEFKQQIIAENKAMEAKIATLEKEKAAEAVYQAQVKKSAAYLSNLAAKDMSAAEASDLLRASVNNLTTAQDRLTRLESSSLTKEEDLIKARTRLAEATKLHSIATQQASKHGEIVGNKIKEIHTKSGVMVHDFTNMMYQLSDIFTTAAMGMSPDRILVQQGPQMAQIFAASKASMAEWGAAIGGALTSPAVLATAAIVGIGVAIYKTASLMHEGAEASISFQNALMATSGYANITEDQFWAMGESIAHANNVSQASVRELEMQAVHSGQVTGDSIGIITEASIRMAKAMGTDAKGEMSTLLALTDNFDGTLNKLENTYKFLTLEQYTHLTAMAKSGDTAGAASETIKILNKHLEGQKENLGYIESAWRGLTTVIDNCVTAIMRWGTEGHTIIDGINNISDAIGNLTGRFEWLKDIITQAQRVLDTFSVSDVGTNAHAPQDSRTVKQRQAVVMKIGTSEYGLPVNSVAGIIGNWSNESYGLDIHAKSHPKPGRTDKGIAQWDPDRQAKAAKWLGKPFDMFTLEDQIRWGLHEFQTEYPKLFAQFKAGGLSPAQAASMYMKVVERPGNDNHLDRREGTANNVAGKSSSNLVNEYKKIQYKQKYDEAYPRELPKAYGTQDKIVNLDAQKDLDKLQTEYKKLREDDYAGRIKNIQAQGEVEQKALEKSHALAVSLLKEKSKQDKTISSNDFRDAQADFDTKMQALKKKNDDAITDLEKAQKEAEKAQQKRIYEAIKDIKPVSESIYKDAREAIKAKEDALSSAISTDSYGLISGLQQNYYNQITNQITKANADIEKQANSLEKDKAYSKPEEIEVIDAKIKALRDSEFVLTNETDAELRNLSAKQAMADIAPMLNQWDKTLKDSGDDYTETVNNNSKAILMSVDKADIFLYKQKLINDAVKKFGDLSKLATDAPEIYSKIMSDIDKATDTYKADKAIENTTNKITELKSTMKDAFKDWIKGGKDFADVLRSIGDRLLDMAINNVFESGWGAVAGASKKKTGSTVKSGLDAVNSVINLFANAKGGVYNSPSLSAYSGQIVSAPTTFAFAKGGALGLMGEAGAEAIMPLRRGKDGKLGVAASGNNQNSGDNVVHLAFNIGGDKIDERILRISHGVATVTSASTMSSVSTKSQRQQTYRMR